jgi:Flp pilus assembly pilin Flp
MVEYGLLMGFIALTVSIGAADFGKHLRNTFKDVVEMLERFFD